jgi:hypothetical protein
MTAFIPPSLVDFAVARASQTSWVATGLKLAVIASISLTSAANALGGQDKASEKKPVKKVDQKTQASDEEIALLGLDARMYLRHAKDWMSALSFKSRAGKVLASERVQPLVAAVKRDLSACNAALDSLKVEYSLFGDIADRIARIRERTDKIQDLQTKIQDAGAKDPVDVNAVAEASSDGWHILDAADVELSGLLQTLKIDGLAPPRRPAATTGDTPKSQPAEPAMTLGKGFRPRTATTLHRAAVDNARALSDYSKGTSPVADDTVLVHLTEMDRQLAALKTEYAKLDDMFRKEKDIEKHMKVVEEEQTKAQSQIDKLKSLSASRKLNATELKEVSDIIYRSLSGSFNQFYQVLGKTGVSYEARHEDPLYSP